MAVGAERFDHYQERCLYDPVAGFYERSGGAGRAGGHFITSPEVGPFFGEVVARALHGWWSAAGRPDRWVVCEVGAGRGALATVLIAALRELGVPVQYRCVERSASLRSRAAELLGADADVAAELPAAADVVVANELLDNLPVRIVERTTAGWAELWVPEELRPTELDLDVAAPAGTRLPVLEAAAAWVRSALDVAPRLLTFDYGVATTAELVDRPWLRTYRGHGRGTDATAAAGSVDVTVDVPVDQLPRPDRVETQATFLRRWGIDELVEEGRARWREGAAIGDLAAIRARSRVVEAEALCDPAGLGGFLALEWGPAVSPPEPA